MSAAAPAASVLVLLLFVSSAKAQGRPDHSAAPPLAHDHWSYELLEALDVAGLASAWMTGVRPVSRVAVHGELQRVREHAFGADSLTSAWARRLDRDFPLGRKRDGAASGAPAGTRLGDRAGEHAGGQERRQEGERAGEGAGGPTVPAGTGEAIPAGAGDAIPAGTGDAIPAGPGEAIHAGAGDAGRRRGWEVGVASGIRSGQAFLDPGDGVFGTLAFAGTLGPVSIWGEADRGAREAFGGVRALGLTLPAGPFDIMMGRQRIRSAGPGATSVQSSGEMPMDGVYVVSNRPVALPGLDWLLGPTAWQFALAPLRGLDETDQVWIGLGGIVAEPHPRLRIGATRTARFGGHPRAPFIAERFLRMFFVIQNDPTNWDDHMLELSLRIRWGLFGQPLGSYLVLAQEDSPLWKDPGVVVGTSAPMIRSSGLYTFRYEYTAYGQRARWCPGCYHDKANWFSHGRLGAFTDRGLPLGDPLGGYGANHQASLAFFAADGRTRARAWASFAVREEGNLLYERWPGKRRSGGLEVGRELVRGMEGVLSGQVADGPRIEREWGLRVSLNAVLGGGR